MPAPAPARVPEPAGSPDEGGRLVEEGSDPARPREAEHPAVGGEPQRSCPTRALLVLAAVASLAAALSRFWPAAHTSSYLSECLEKTTFSCPAPLDGSKAGGVSNKGSEGTSGKLWKATKQRSFNGTLLFERGIPGKIVTLQPVRKLCKNWAVITTIFPPTVLVKQLVAMQDWCVCVVGDRKGPELAQYLSDLPSANMSDRFVYIDAVEQERMRYGIMSKLKWNHFGRKNVGFLFAILHGAELIYDTDDDNELLGASGLSFWGDVLKAGQSRSYSILKTCQYYFNPYPMFGSRQQDSQAPEFMWPRGFPLDGLRSCASMMEDVSHPSQTMPASSIGVLQSLANHDPDVDAIFRLRHHLPIDFPVQGDRAVLVPKQSMVPFNAQATLWSRQSAWGLLLPITVHGRVSDIWRGYIVQRLMWDMNQHLGFAEPWVQQIRNAHTYLADFESETPLYLKAGELIRFLLAWRPSEPISGRDALFAAAEELCVALYEVGVLGLADVELQQAWLKDLLAVGWSL